MSLSDTPNPNLTTDHSTMILKYLEKKLLTRLVKSSHFDKYASKTVLGSRAGKSYTWHRFDNLAEDTPVLTEGVNPAGVKLSSNEITVTLTPYGKVVSITDLMEATGIASVTNAAGEILADHARLLIDRLYREELIANGTQYFAKGNANRAAVNVDSTAVMTSEDIRNIRKQFKANSVPVFEDQAYKGIVSVEAENQLLGESVANAAIQLTSNVEQGRVMSGNIGKIWGIDIMCSDNLGATDPGNTNTQLSVFFGKDAFAGVKHSDLGLEFIRKDRKSGGVSNALELFGTVGYKLYFAPKVLEDKRIIVANTYSA